jgi:hypothetical protein
MSSALKTGTPVRIPRPREWERMVTHERDQVRVVREIRVERIPKELDIFLLLRCLKRQRKVIGQLEGFLHDSSLRDNWCFFAPEAGEGGLDFLLETLDQLAIGTHQRLLGF